MLSDKVSEINAPDKRSCLSQYMKYIHHIAITLQIFQKVNSTCNKKLDMSSFFGRKVTIFIQ